MNLQQSYFNLDGHVALVTGGSRGIGSSIALALAQAGAKVIVHYRERSADAQSVVSEIQGLGGTAVALQGDMGTDESILHLVDVAKRAMGTIDILVNNAGLAITGRSLSDGTAQAWDRTMNVNLRAAVTLIDALRGEMQNQSWGRIINVSSEASFVGGIVSAEYTASKAGMWGLSHFYAAKLADRGITVNTITPALIDTDMLSGLNLATAEKIPVGRFGTAGEVAKATLMLVCNGYMTGQTVHVNGGMYFT